MEPSTNPRPHQERLMDRSRRTPAASRQRALPFPATSRPVEPWDRLAERHRLECRQALRQMLAAVARHGRADIDPDAGHPGRRTEGPGHE
jgi:hypothetical protein